MITCPRCLGSFRTLYQENKRERCPYCAQVVVHTQQLADLSPKEQTALSLEEFQAWMQSNLDFLNTWWAAQDVVDLQSLDALIRQLEKLNSELTDMRRRLLKEHSDS